MSPSRVWTGSVASHDRCPIILLHNGRCVLPDPRLFLSALSTNAIVSHKLTRLSSKRSIRVNIFSRARVLDPPPTKRKRLRARLPATTLSTPSTTQKNLVQRHPQNLPPDMLTAHGSVFCLSPNASSLHPPHQHVTLSYRSAYHRIGSLGADHPS